MIARLAAGVLVCVLAGVPAVRAAETQWWVSNQASDYDKARSEGVAVGADGVLSAGPAARRIALDSLRTPWSLAVLPDGSVAIAGDRGRVLRWTASGGVRPWAVLGRGQVLSLCADGDGVLAGTGPNGLLYRISARGDTTRLAATGERYVWAIAPAGKDAWWLATGTRGRLLRYERGRVRTLLDSEESNLVSLAVDRSGAAVVGGDSQGRIVRVTPEGDARTLFDAAEDEVRALAFDREGVLWAAALSGSAVTDEGSDDDEKPKPARPPVANGRAILYRIAPDSGAVAWWTSPQPLVYALADSPDGLRIATGSRAGLYVLEGPQAAGLRFSPDAGQITALATGRDGALYAATANPPALWRLGPASDGDGLLTAATLDARRFAAFGRLRWTGAGSPRFETRSGNCEDPDTTWSPWIAPGTGGDGEAVRSPGARWLQWRVHLPAGARVDEVSVAWREQNLPPRVENLTVAEQGRNLRDGELSTRSDAVTQTLPSGQRVEYSVNMSSNKPLRELPLWARGLRTLQWRGSDPNGDPLTYRAEVRRDPDGPWIEIGKDLEASLFTWNTVTLPDGRYRVRITASDRKGNALGEEATGSAVSEPFGVDNTPPLVDELVARPGATGVVVRGEAHDATSPLWRLELAVDDGDWRLVPALGGLADRRVLGFEFALPALAPGEHLLSLRAVDQAGNAATRAIPVTVPGRK